MESLKEKTAKGMLWGGLNNAMMQVIGLAFGIVLGRLLSPSDYGMMAMLSVFSLIATSLQNSGFTTGLINLDKPKDEDYNSVFFFNIIVGTSIYAILFFCAPLISHYYHEPRLTPLSRYAFLGFVFSSFATAQNAWLYKNLKAKQQAKGSIAAVLISSAVGTACALNGLAYWSLATQTNVYILCNTLFAWHYSPWRPDFRHVTFEPVRRMFPFSVKVMANNIVNNINNNILNILLGHYFTAHDTGNYNQAYQWNSKVWYTLQSMANQVAQPVLVSLRNEKERQVNVLRKLIRFASFMSFPAMLGFGLIAKEFIVLAIGEKWLTSAGYIQILCLSGAVMPIYTILTNMIVSKGRSGAMLTSTVVFALVQLASMLILWPHGIRNMIVVFTVLNVGWIFVWHAMVWRMTGYGIVLFLKDTLPFALAAFAVMGATHAATLPIHDLWLLLFARIIMAAALYYTVMRLARAQMLMECQGFILGKLRRNKQNKSHDRDGQ